MVRMMKAYLLKESNMVVTDKAMIKNSNSDAFEEVTLAVKMEDIKAWHEEIELMGLDDESKDEWE